MELPELEHAKGSPAWMATFGDLMSLLLCFFVLLFSFSQIDALKFKQIAGSMKMGFGVQNQIEAEQVPMGTSAVLDKFSPGTPKPTPIEVIEQQASPSLTQTINVREGESIEAGGMDATLNAERRTESFVESEQVFTEAKKRIEEQLAKHIEDGAMELEDKGQQLIIRLKEQGSFPAGSAYLQSLFLPVIDDIAEALANVPGDITVSGHTDDTRVSTELYRNNWDLSSQRAVAVASELEKNRNLNSTRISIQAFADKQPLVENSSKANRSINRRVEIAITHGKPLKSEPVSLTNGEQ